jgi:heterodisulfide reductase subunit B
MSEIHKHVSGVPKLKQNKFYSCSTCISTKFRKNHIGTTKKMTKSLTDKQPCEVGQNLHVNFGLSEDQTGLRRTMTINLSQVLMGIALTV